jgi:hypothetical protein
MTHKITTNEIIEAKKTANQNIIILSVQYNYIFLCIEPDTQNNDCNYRSKKTVKFETSSYYQSNSIFLEDTICFRLNNPSSLEIRSLMMDYLI